MPKCQHPNGITIKPDGVNELDPCVYEDVEVYKNVTVTVSRCMNCGNIEISWQRQPETECLHHENSIENWDKKSIVLSPTNEGGFNTMGISTDRINSLLESGMNQTKPKALSDTYLYSKVSDYETKLIKFVVEADRIDTNSEAFADLLYDIKRRSVNNSLIKVLLSKNIVLGVHSTPLSGAFKVFTARDIKSKEKNTKVFIDLTGIVSINDGNYTCPIQKVDHIVSHLISAACQRIYYGVPDKFINNTTIISCGSEIFAKLVNYVIDYLYKVNTIPVNKQKLEYMSSMYYQICILNKDFSERIRSIAIKQARISEKEADLIDIHTPKEAYDNINEFIQAIAKVLHLNKLTLDIFLNKWIFLYGTGTQFATETFYAFSSMITNAYVGAYINNQKTIEKVIGQDLVEFTTKILEIESGVLDG